MANGKEALTEGFSWGDVPSPMPIRVDLSRLGAARDVGQAMARNPSSPELIPEEGSPPGSDIA